MHDRLSRSGGAHVTLSPCIPCMHQLSFRLYTILATFELQKEPGVFQDCHVLIAPQTQAGHAQELLPASG
jgi:hypothetical protein